MKVFLNPGHGGTAPGAISKNGNSFCRSSANGVEVLYYEYSSKGEELAQIMQNALVKGTGLEDRGIIPRNDVHVLKRTKAPAILVELAFLSNPQEEQLLLNYQDIFVDALYQGIKDIINNTD